jgi:pyruvate dehydrogenase kinase 2/3/4
MDEGGGIPRSQMDHIWSYLFTTADPNIQHAFLYNKDSKQQQSSPILAGLGYGLPMSRAYARYFGGDLDIISMEGYGTDAFCYLVRLEGGDDTTTSSLQV